MVFGDEDEAKKASRQIQEIKQTGSVADYATKFRGLAAVLTWDDDYLITMFKKGLKPKIRETYIHRKTPDSLKDLITETIEVDNEL